MKEIVCKIDWVKSFSDLPSKAAIFDTKGKILKDISYNRGIYIEEVFDISLDELGVVKIVKEFESESIESCYVIFDNKGRTIIEGE